MVLVRKPKSFIRVEHSFAKGRQKLLEDTATVNPRPERVEQELAFAYLIQTERHTLLAQIGL